MGLWGERWRRRLTKAERLAARERWPAAHGAARRARRAFAGSDAEGEALDALVERTRRAAFEARLADADALGAQTSHPRRYYRLSAALTLADGDDEVREVLRRCAVAVEPGCDDGLVVQRGDLVILSAHATNYGLALAYLEDPYLTPPWLHAVLRTRLATHRMVAVSAGQRLLRSAVEERGWAVCGVDLAGSVESARAGLGGAPDLAHLGVELRAPRSDAEREAVIALHARVLGAEPHLLPRGYELERHLAELRRTRASDLADARLVERVVLRDGAVVGHIGAHVAGQYAGVVVVLEPSLRGRGALRPLYRALLEPLARRGVTTFTGYTEHPAVIRVARELGRLPFRVHYAADGEAASWWRERLDDVWW